MVLKYMGSISNEEKLYEAVLWFVLEFYGRNLTIIYVVWLVSVNPIRLMNLLEFDIPCRRKMSFTLGLSDNWARQPRLASCQSTTPIVCKIFK